MLRAVNVGGRKLVMSELRAVCEKAGFTGVKTLLASGNLVLGAKESGPALEARLEALIEKALGLKTAVHVRSPAELESIVAANPFPAFAKMDPSHLVVVFLKATLGPAEAGRIEAAATGVEEIAARGRELYVTYPAGIGDSKLRIPVEGTARNWNTVTKLAAMARGE